MKLFLTIGLIIVCVGLCGFILLQAKGTGLGTMLGGSGEFYHSRRGVEKVVLYGTVILAILFAVFSFGLLLDL